ncbi:MAG: 4-hydroxybenzoate 3-monooxygenase [Spirosomataceae bacterium]
MNHPQVGIIGAGPAGLTLALVLHRAGISSVILENRSKEYVTNRVRAGLLEQNTVDLFNELGVGERMQREGDEHHGVFLSFDGTKIRIPFDEYTNGRHITIYGQQEVVKDLIAACEDRGIPIRFECEAVRIADVETTQPTIYFVENGEEKALSCAFVAACDGFHGIGRKTLPKDSYHEYRIEYPFSWLGVLAYAAPASEELIYSYHRNGFALHSLRSEKVSRLYLQVPNDDSVENWSDERIFDELDLRLADGEGFKVNRGEIFEKSITPMRSFMIDNMQHGRLFLAGDAAHIVPPTGGKGLNLAVSDIRFLSAALIQFFQQGNDVLLNRYSEDCLRRIWRAQDFSNYMTTLFHKQDDHDSYTTRLQKARFDYIRISKAMATNIAENYVGLKEI